MSDFLTDESGLEHQVKKVLSDYFSVSWTTIEIHSRLVEDLYVDSVGVVEIVMALNEAFGIDLPEEGVEQWKTVGDICELVNATARSLDRIH
ncbi:acyl carrier protein [Pseudomonas fluorescens]|jgi:acyl carrier protein|uniref:Acyl carrier protein n=1 Tax=Pseudomonas fluorescens TaxID=294 RepID=A0A5E7IYT3_PSEFL|nr:acyl carrier protein [Pseudomonas fluorescens]VVO81026.1 Acyl carrier protein [Pseudomonas fluorescens]